MRVKVRPAYAASVVGHAAVLAWSMWSLMAKPLPAPPGEALPVDLVNVTDFTQLTAGSTSAAKADTPRPMAEKPGEAPPVEDPTAKIDTKVVKAAQESAPAPEVKPTEVKQEKKPTETKPPDPIAEALAKEEVKQKAEPKKAEAKPVPVKKPAPPAPKFDPRQVEALLDKRQATRLAALGSAPNPSPSAGVPHGAAHQMSLSELDALRQRLSRLWTIPPGAKPDEITVLIRVRLRPDGTLASAPQVLNGGSSPLFVAARDSAIRALYRGQPYDMLRPETYEQWKDIEINFDPRTWFGG